MAASTNFTHFVPQTRSISVVAGKVDKLRAVCPILVTSGSALVELRFASDASNMPRMFFGDEHLGKAVAMLREGADLNQKQLAHEIGVSPNTMNQYESGRRGMSEEVIAKVARVLQRDAIEIWDMSYSIFRFNHFRERAEKEGVAVEELIAGTDVRPSVGVILELRDALEERRRQLLAAVLKFLDPVARAGLGGLGLTKIVVRAFPRKATKTRRAIRFNRKQRPNPPEPPRRINP